MFIKPMQNITSITDIGKIKDSTIETGEDTSSFNTIFTDVLNDYIESEKAVDADIKKISSGESTDTHNLMINAQKAELSLNFLVQMRNKVLDSYNEIMRTGV